MVVDKQKTPILGRSIATADQMLQYVHKHNPAAPDYAQLYLSIGEKYGVRGDLAFCQAILETGTWTFTGTVRSDQNNFAGLGATGAQTRGASFASPEQGIEAQIQHLYGYATTAPFPEGNPTVDPRFSILKSAGLRGSAPYWEDLDGKWAVPGTSYGEDIVNTWNIILQIPSLNPTQVFASWKDPSMQWLKDQQLINSPHDPDAPVTWAEFGIVLSRFFNKKV